MRAARFVGPDQPIQIQHVDDPVPGRGEVLVRVEACGICASDLRLIKGEMPPIAPLPLTMGHEASGVIAATGDDVPSWRSGDRVSLMGGRTCMRCPCRCRLCIHCSGILQTLPV